MALQDSTKQHHTNTVTPHFRDKIKSLSTQTAYRKSIMPAKEKMSVTHFTTLC
jgi:hypothetical protein